MSNLSSLFGQVFHMGNQKLIIGGFLVIIVLIPMLAYLLAQRNTQVAQNNVTTRNFAGPVTTAHDTPSTSSADLLKQALANSTTTSTASDNSDSTTTTTAINFGPTLSLKITIDGRPNDNQATKLFVGIAAGEPMDRPSYLLSFTVDVPANGVFEGISLAGLTPGTQYTAYLKGQAQIATASAFVMAPGVTMLNNGQTLNLLTGDMNEDNVVNAADYAIVKAAVGSKQGDANWNHYADFNLDGVVNSTDLAILMKNYGQTGLSGAWYSPPPSATMSATQSASVTGGGNIGGGPVGFEHNSSTPSGYWLWVPN